MVLEKSREVRKTEKAPRIYQDYFKKEVEWLKKRIKHTSSLLDAGCGEGRLALFLSSLTDSYVGIDADSKAISKAKKSENGKTKFIALDVTNLSEYFSPNSFQTSVCLWNTIGNIEDDAKALKEIHHVTDKNCFITTLKKGTLKARINYYTSYGLKYELDEENEIFRSEAWGVARAYSKENFRKMCEAVGFRVVEIVDLGKIGFGIELKK